MEPLNVTFTRTDTGLVGRAEAPVAPVEASEEFRCFGTTCAAYVIGDTPERTATEAVQLAHAALLEWHHAFSRFLPDSELSRLNDDPRTTVPVSATMVRFVAACREAAELTGGLADPTLAREIEAAGYRGDLPDETVVSLREALDRTSERAPGGPSRTPAWREINADEDTAVVTRPSGTRLDSGGVAKGLFADLLVAALDDHDSVAINCGGDLRIGGRGHHPRDVEVSSPFGAETLHTFELARGGVATSGIGKRSWIDAAGRPAHHLLDPATGRPAFTGVVQVTAIAPTAVEAEARTKAALLSGPEAAAGWLPFGGVVVYDDERFDVIPARL
jgi:thiamine biosynthesis lipoprotein